MGNWNNNGQFAPGNGNVTFAGIQAQSISGSANHTFCGLEINNMSAEGIVLNRPVRINCMLNLTNGVIHSTNVNMLIFNPGSASEIGNENAFVSGPIKKIGDTDFIFPTGRDTIWAPIGITAPSVISDEFVAEYFFEANENAESPCTNCALGVRRVSTVEYWDISPTNGNSTPDVTLYFKDMARSVITDVNDLCFAHWNGSVWERMCTFNGFMDGPNSCYVTGTDFISFSPVTAGSENGANALPIELIEFNAIVNNSDVVLKWTTASETNNHYFTIERSLDGINFQEISIVQGKGNSSVKTNYVTIDKDLMAGQYYYRLKQTDFDGQYSYSHIISALVIIESKLKFEIWPIPSTKDVVNIVFSHNSNLPVNISISDVTSKIVFEKEYETFNNYLQLNLAKEYSFKTGVYYITVSTKENTITKQIVVIE